MLTVMAFQILIQILLTQNPTSELSRGNREVLQKTWWCEA